MTINTFGMKAASTVGEKVIDMWGGDRDNGTNELFLTIFYS
jgi:hypothetical protein